MHLWTQSTQVAEVQHVLEEYRDHRVAAGMVSVPVYSCNAFTVIAGVSIGCQGGWHITQCHGGLDDNLLM